LASTASATLIYADNTNYSGAWSFRPDQFEEITLDTGQALNVRVSAPPVSVLLSGTMIVKELTRTK
jgi:hypothetical protein